MSYFAGQQLGNAVGDGVSNVASSSFLENHGNKVGAIFSLLYVGLSLWILKMKYISKDSSFNNNIILLIPFFLILTVIIDLVYYLKNKDDSDTKKVNSYVANISLAPIYLGIFVLVMIVILNIK